MPFKHLSLDLWGTLIKSNPEYRVERNNLINEVFGVSLSDETIKANKAKLDQLMKYSGDQPTFTQAMTILVEPKEFTFSDFQTKVDFFYMRHKYLVDKHPPLLIPEAVEVVKEAYKKVPLYILSNTTFINGKMLRRVLIEHNLDFYFKRLLFSDEHLYCKPHYSFFSKLYHASDSMYNILHVGDDNFTDNFGGAPNICSFIITPENPITNVLNLI